MKKILLIEDEVIIRETLAEILEISNYEVLEAQNGMAGLKKAIETFPDLVICDMMMPQMNGIDTITAFRKHPNLKYIPFVFLSALSEKSDIRKGMNLGAEDYLTKPIKTKDLLRVIDLQLKKSNWRTKKRSLMGCDDIQTNMIKVLKEKVEKENQKWQECMQSAGRIQSVILPNQIEINSIIPNNFNFFKPKYSVSGDFYWVQTFKDSKLIAVADCTGHGIAASLLTICCYNGLNLAVKQFGLREPKEILEKVNQIVLDFMKEHNREHFDLGMDVIICSINEREKTLKYAGAKRPLYIVTEGLDITDDENVSCYKQLAGNPLYKIKGSLYTIGSANKNIELVEQTIKYKSGDLIYLSSDGYADQLGGPLDKRFKSLNLIQLLTSIQDESMADQHKILAETFSIWKGDAEQTDDVTILGVKL